MGVFNRKYAVLGWLTWTVGKRAVRYGAKDAAQSAKPTVDPKTKKPNKSAIALGAATVAGLLMFAKKRSDGSEPPPPPPES